MKIIRRILALAIGRRVIVTSPLAFHVDEVECWARFADDCTVRTLWHGKQIVLNTDGTVTGLPTSWESKWRVKK